MKRASAAVALAASAVLAAGCSVHTIAMFGQSLPGSGKIVEEDRQVGDFSKVEVDSILQATVTLGEAPALHLKGDDNLLKLIKTEVRDGRLVAKLESDGNVQPTEPIRLTIVAPRLEGLYASGAAQLNATAARSDRLEVEASGASKVAVDRVDTPTLRVDASGASTIRLNGRGETVKLGASGASQVDATKLAADSADVQASGASSIRVHARQSIRGDASGASNVQILGKPARSDVSTSGAANVHHEAASE